MNPTDPTLIELAVQDVGGRALCIGVVDHRIEVDVPGDDIESTRRDFVKFYEAQHGGQVRRAYLLVRSNELANDIVHDAMVGVWRHWPLENPAGYLSQAVLNGCRDAGRRRTSRGAIVRRLRPNAADRPETEVLDDILATLPFNQRAAVVLRYYGGWSSLDIAEALNCSVNSVGPWITRGLAAMRKELA